MSRSAAFDIANIISLFTKHATLMRRSMVPSLTHHLVFPGCNHLNFIACTSSPVLWQPILKGRLLTLPTNIRLGWMWLTAVHQLANNGAAHFKSVINCLNTPGLAAKVCFFSKKLSERSSLFYLIYPLVSDNGERRRVVEDLAPMLQSFFGHNLWMLVIS